MHELSDVNHCLVSVQRLKPMCICKGASFTQTGAAGSEVQGGDQGLWKQSREETEEMVGGRVESGVEAQMPKNPTCYSVDVCGKKTLAILVRGPEPTNQLSSSISRCVDEKKTDLAISGTVAICVSSGR